MSHKDALYLIRHIILPPQLPHKSDDEENSGQLLLEVARSALIDFKHCLTIDHGISDAPIAMLSRMIAIHSGHVANDVLELELQRALNGLTESGDAIPLYIGAQNAGVIISKVDSNVHFEMFELSPLNSAVIGAKGRLRRSFPASAIAIGDDTFNQSDFQFVVAQTLALMSHQAAPGLQPRAKKASQMHDEDRDTTHPGMVTEFFNGFLAAVGNSVDVETIGKNTREEVFYDRARKPWRRSPLWLLIRVSLQLSFRRLPSQRDLYKDFMVFFMSRVAKLSKDSGIPADLLYAINAKLARRLMKIENIDHGIFEAVGKVMRQTQEVVATRWTAIQERQARFLDLSAVSSLDFDSDSRMPLAALDDYIELRRNEYNVLRRKAFHPTSTLVIYEPDILPSVFVDRDDLGMLVQNLHGFETWVGSHLTAWAAAHMGDPNACAQLADVVRRYHSTSASQYAGNPEAMSIMVLVVMELWVACDKTATSQCSLLTGYNPGISSKALQNLLLPFEDQMRRLRSVESHINHRSNSGYSSELLFDSPGSPSSFSARFFDQSDRLKELLQKITKDAEIAREEKLAEFSRKKDEYTRLISLYNQACCEYHEVVVDSLYDVRESRHASYCQKCRYKSQAASIQITVHEWPLPINSTKAKTILFELCVPPWFCHWRDTCSYVQLDVLKADYGHKEMPGSTYHLSTDPHLSKYRHIYSTEVSRIGLLSQTKPHIGTHRKGKEISTASVSDVCPNNGLNYSYFDRNLGCFVVAFNQSDEIPHACTYALPSRSRSLQNFIFRPARSPSGPSPNTVIASQSQCPDHMTLNEFKDLCSVPVGYHLQWMDIAAQLAMPSVEFKKTEVGLVILQCIYQAGPSSETGGVHRCSHELVNDLHFAQVLIKQLYNALERIKENWESLQTLGTLIAIARRVLSLNTSEIVQRKALRYLVDARAVAFGWVELLRLKFQGAGSSDREEFLARSVEAALICATSFDVERIHLPCVLRHPDHASILFQCCVIIHQGEHTILISPEPQSRLMYMRHQRLVLDSYTRLVLAHQAVDDAMQKVWAVYKPGPGWQTVLRHWIVSHVDRDKDCDALEVHYNVLSGELLVNGVPIDRLPAEYERHKSYGPLFGQCALEVVPSNVSGMRFSSKNEYRGFLVSFGMTESSQPDLLVCASTNYSNFKLLPSRLFRTYLPDFFVDNFIHWYDCESGDVEFRPKADPWYVESSQGLLLVKCGRTSLWRLQVPDSGSFVLGTRNRTATTLSNVLSSLASPLQIHLTLRTAPLYLEIEIPGLRLGFSLEQGSPSLKSREHRGMFIDANQSLGTLVGYHSKLLLKNEQTSERVAIILEGSVSFSKAPYTLGSASVILGDLPDVYSSRQLTQRSYSFRVDDRLGRMVGSGGLQSQLFLAYLHALTSFCLPDPLTHKTGTEQALVILRSAGVRSFAQLTQENLDILKLIADLTPRRGYYPTNERVMQTVDWSPQLSYLSQHAGFYKAVSSILSQARQSSLFYPELPGLPDMKGVDQHLIERDAIRSSTFRVSNFGAEDHTCAHDASYNSRDLDQTSIRRESAYVFSSMVNQARESFHYGPPPRDTLWHLIQSASCVYGPDQPLELSHFRYDASFDKQENGYVLKNWASLHRELSKKCSPTINKFSLMVWLSTLACFSIVPNSVLEVLGLFYTRIAMLRIHPPSVDSLLVQHGHQISVTLVQSLVRCHLRPLDVCPGYSIPRNLRETQYNYDMRRSSHVKSKQETALRLFAEGFTSQWPCETPFTAVYPSTISSYIKTEPAVKVVEERFRQCHENLRFFQYLEVIETEIAALPCSRVSLPQQSLLLHPAIPSRPGFMSVSKLFQRPAPPMPPSYGGRDLIVTELETETSAFRLELFLTQLKKQVGDSQYEQHYMTDLASSFEALKKSKYLDEARLESLEYWHAYAIACAEKVRAIYKILTVAVTHAGGPGSSTPETAGAWQVNQWPRLGPTTFLRCLDRKRWQRLHADWQSCIVQYGMAFTALQRAERIVGAYRAGCTSEIRAEIENTGHQNWSALDYPESLLLEVESDIMIRRVQEQIASEMRRPKSGTNTTMQLNMGEGKSSVIVPVVATALADGARLVRVIVGRPQSKQMAQMLISKFGGMLNRRVYYMPFSRSIKLDEAGARTVHEICQECMSHGGVLLVQPEHILSFQLMILDRYISARTLTGQSLLRTQMFFDHFSRDIVDESDENFSVKFELIYTMGMQRQIDLSPDRWLCIHQVLGLVERIARDLDDELPSSMEINQRSASSFPRIRILRSDAESRLVDRVGHQICHTGCLVGFPISRQPATIRDAVFTYITKSELNGAEVESVEKSAFWTDITKEKLFLLRGLLAGGILIFSFARKRWRVSYGLDSTRRPPTRLAVPYRAKDLPTARSEFSHPDVVILLTSLSYYYRGLTHDELLVTFSHLLESGQKESEYQEWVEHAPDLPVAFKQLEGVNLKDRPACVSKLFPALSHVKAVVDYFLSNIVFPKEMREFPHKLSASGWDLGKVKHHPTTGFSGTCDSKTLLPIRVAHLDLPEQRHTNALVLDYLLRDENSVMYIPPASVEEVSDAERLLSAVMGLRPSPRVILDVGAQVLELNNLGIARAWLHKYSQTSPEMVQAVVFFNDQDELSVLDCKGRIELLQTSSYAYQLDLCLVFLDEAHTRGTDLKLPPHFRAAVTLGPNLTKDRLVQACMRMRNLGKGQSVVFCVNDEIRRRIEDCTKQGRDSGISVSDVLRWVVSETFADIRRSIPLWAVQGKRFVNHNRLWEDIREDPHLMTKDFAERFMEEEAQSLETRYRPKTPERSIVLSGLTIGEEPDLDAIAKQCQQFEDLQFNGSALQEEQERELSPEMEQERQVQRPDPANPAIHHLHPDVRRFVTDGTMTASSDGYIPAFSSLSDISAAQTYDVSQLAGDGHLLVTKDFARTVEREGRSYRSDAFLRGVQWILTFTPSGAETIKWIMIVSPYEAQELYPSICKGSAVVLHIYKPCWNRGYTRMDELNFLTIPTTAESGSLPRTLKAQLNLFACQLYFSSPEDYTTTCSFLGLAGETTRSGWIVAPDGFILEDETGTPGAKSGLRHSPVGLIKTLTNIRINDSGRLKTHMGRLLDGALVAFDR